MTVPDTDNRKRPKLEAAKVLQLISKDGILSKTIRGFESRIPQQKMMHNVIEAYNNNGIALIEAGTGTGKSMAYLLPALFWALEHQQRTVISTHTIALQEQLIQKDIPQIINALNMDIKAVLVKGMSNYICLRKFYDTQHETLLMSEEERKEFEKIEAWTETTKNGSKNTLPMMPSLNLWEKLHAERDSCTLSKCPHFKRCFFFKARHEAENAQILVVNHHLLFADLSMRAELDNYKDPAILPVYSRIILDEAHHIEDIATEFFGAKTSTLAILRILGKIVSENQSKSLGKLNTIKEKLHSTFTNSPPAVDALLLRINLDLVSLRRELQTQIVAAFQAIQAFVDSLDYKKSQTESKDEESKLRFLKSHFNLTTWQTHVMPSAKTLIDALNKYVAALGNLEIDLELIAHEAFQEQSKSMRMDLAALTNRLTEHANLLVKLIQAPPQENKVRWIEIKNSKHINNVTIQDADLDISKAMIDYLFSRFSSIVLCSATLTTNQEFSFIRNQLGILAEKLPRTKITENIYESPFNYKEQALLAIPTDLPDPSHATFIQKASEQIWIAIQASRGSTFVLFTSYGMLQECSSKLTDLFQKHNYHLFKQGDSDRQKLLTQFKTTPRSVLFGTDSFWEGIDVAGEALRCVILVKLPFKVPTEPIIQARSEAIKANGGDPFTEYSLPTAIVKFKQGFGRLIRHANDRGCIICLDTRLVHKNYGKLFIDSLPDCKKSFTLSGDLDKQMRAFYRKTHYLVAPK